MASEFGELEKYYNENFEKGEGVVGEELSGLAGKTIRKNLEGKAGVRTIGAAKKGNSEKKTKEAGRGSQRDRDCLAKGRTGGFSRSSLDLVSGQ